MLTADFDTLTREHLTQTVGKKWTTFPDCIGAFIAEMDFGTAPEVQRALHEMVEAGYFGYLPDSLERDLSLAASGWYRRNTDWDPDPARIHSIPDVLKVLELTLKLYAPRGGKVIVPTPAYMPFLMLPERLGREQIEVPLIRDEAGWHYDLDALDQAFRNGGEVLILCNPHNPIGKVLTAGELLAISEVVDRHGGRVFSDEIHAPILYSGNRHVPYASVSEVAASHTITAIAASKAWNLAGLKCAQVVLSNDADVEIWAADGGWTAHGASTLGVVASIAAFNEGQPWLDGVIGYLEGNRRLLGEMLADLLPEVRYLQSEGTYLSWLDFSHTGLDGDLAQFFREEAQVAVTAGSWCGEVGARSIRFNFAMPRPLLEQAISQMATALRAV